MPYRLVHGATQGLPDVARFLDLLNRLHVHPAAVVRTLFDPAAPLVVTRAPGRLDVMGGIADYSGSLVLQLPLAEAALVALQPAEDRVLRVVSLGAEHSGRSLQYEMPLGRFEQGGRPIPYEAARAQFERDPADHWAAYVLGAFLVLMRERGCTFAQGARLLVASDVPEGKGVSSSAALEVAVMQAVAAAFDVRMTPRETALLCQQVENRVAGAPCGVMDQMTAACGEANRLLALLCQPAELQGTLRLPEEVGLWGLDSGIRHAVSGADYGAVRAGAFMGYRIIADLAGLPVRSAGEDGAVRVEDPSWGGYLANVPPSLFMQDFSARLPAHLRGAAFLRRYAGTTDPVTRVRPDRSYAVRTPTAHPVHEHFRVRLFTALLPQADLETLGELMYQSHASYSACGLGAAGTDRLVELARRTGAAEGLYGAKITGGGSGGTVAVLGRSGAMEAVERIAAAYTDETGREARLFSGSSPGAAAFGYLHLLPV